MEQIPENILEWIEHIPFNQLQEEQQKKVLRYLTKAEYQMLHETALTTREILMEEAATMHPSEETAEKLIMAFDRKQHKTKQVVLTPFREKRILLWQAAASWILIAGAVWFVLQSRYAGNTGISTSLAADTIYIEKITEAAPKLIHDTVYLIEKAVVKAVTNNPTPVKQEEFSEPPVYSESNPVKYPLTTSVPGMHILSIRDKDNALNNKSGIPVLDDTLVKKHGFVTL